MNILNIFSGLSVRPSGKRLSLGILAVGALIRIIGYTSAAIWFDEAMTIYRAQLPLGEMLSNRSEFSGNLLWELLMRPVVAINDSAAAVRLPALLLGILSLWLAWMLMEKLDFGTTSRHFTCLFIAFLPSLIWTSQDARQYALLTCLYLLGGWYALNGQWLGLLASAGLISYTHFVGPAFALGMLAVALVVQPWEWRRIGLIGALAISAWLPWVAYRTQLIPLEDFWLVHFQLPLYIREFSLTFWIGSLAGRWLLAAFYVAAGSILLAFITTRGRHSITLILFLAPLLILLARTLTGQNVIFYRTLSPLVIPLGIWMGQAIFEGDRPAALPVLAIWAVLLGGAVAHWDPAARGASIDLTANMIKSDWQSGDILYYGTITAAMPFNYYLPDKAHFIMDGPVDPNLNPPDVAIFQKASLQSLNFTRAWVIFPDDEVLLDRRQLTRLRRYAACGEAIAQLVAPQTERILVYRVSSEELEMCAEGY